jgi:hypothetical protein
VLPILAKVRRWWFPDVSRIKGVAVYQVRCRCGASAVGPRQRRFQVIPCEHCGRDLFVLPIGPLPSVAGSPIESRTGSASPTAKPATRWRGLALLVAVAGFVAMGLYFVAVFGPWWAGQAGREAKPRSGRLPAEPYDELLKTARGHLAVGNFRQALERLQDLAAGQDRGEAARSRREWGPLLAQAALLAELSAESLEEILDHAAGAHPAEWELEFPPRFRGKAFVFDVELSGPVGGPYRHNWPLPHDVHMDFSEVQLLRQLPLTEPTRLLFGARLDKVCRDTPASWEVRFEPASAVLLTDPAAAAACCPYMPEAELLVLVRHQAGWLR